MRTNGRFATALHVLAVLAYKNGDRVSSEFLSRSVNTNPVIIRRLLRALQEAKLIETHKGPGAGSRLSRSAVRISLAEVYSAVCAPKLFSMPRRKPNGQCPVGQGIRAALQPLFVSAQEALERELGKTSVADLLESVERKNSSTAYDKCN